LDRQIAQLLALAARQGMDFCMIKQENPQMRFRTSMMAARQRMRLGHVLALFCAAFLGILVPSVAEAQSRGGFGGFGFPGGPAGGSKVKLSASYELKPGGQEGRLLVTANIEPGWHLYSVTQPPGGPLVTSIKVKHDDVKLSGPFVPNVAPDIKSEELVWPGLPIEEHYGEVTWTAPFKLQAAIEPEATKIAVELVGQVCMTDGSCIPVSEKAEASFKGFFGAAAAVEELRVEGTHALWSAVIERSVLKPGDSTAIRVRALTDKGYHVYPFVAGDPETQFRTLIVATSKAGLRFGAPTTAAETEAQDAGLDEPVVYHKGPVEWVVPISVPENAGEGEHPIALQVGFLTCSDRSCDKPSAVELKGSVTVARDADDQTSAPMTLASIPYRDVAGHPNLISWIDTDPRTTVATEASWSERAAGNGLEMWMVFAALAGGFILNFMPCVLPVIGLKLMSFVNQSGNNHSRVVALNLNYVAGILAVMLVLALLNIGAKLAGQAFGWGQHFQHLGFQVPMTVLLFAMSLSFLGVWEIPIPGFATSSKSGELLEKEGLSGAFFKGILTTILATPCSGPFLGTLFGLTLTLSVTSILLLYLLVGIGLGLPYLALCISPALLKFLPKPGAWMETLKQVLAFPLLLTVVYFVSLINPDYRIATLGLLIIVWFACWLIGRVPAYAEGGRLRAAWLTGGATIAVGSLIMFSYFGPVKHELPWVPYKEATLAKYRAEGKTVMIEFTARWCLTCQANMKFAIDRPKVAQLVDKNDVVTLLADLSEPDEEISRKIRELESNSIPLLAIYPADPDAEPIILRDLITESQLLEALKKAGPSSRSSGILTSTR
jgi:suppressor for copper-sensitivity B